LSCLSSLAEFPERIEKLFVQDISNVAGIYALRFMIDGVPRIVVVDDLFPYDSHKEQWAFSRPDT
jgi:hypothetical protein